MVQISRQENAGRWANVHQGMYFILSLTLLNFLTIQLAQWAALRADLFPSLLCEKMGALHSRGKPHSLMHTKEVVEKALARPFDEIFEVFDENPIGVGAIAQVGSAWASVCTSGLTVHRSTGKLSSMTLYHLLTLAQNVIPNHPRVH